MSRAPRLVLATIGSLGDLHPYLSLGRYLADRGVKVRLVSIEAYRARVERLGLDFAPIGPRDVSPEDPEIAKVAFEPRRGMERMVRELLLPHIVSNYADLAAACADADGLVSGSIIYVAPLLAEKTGIRWVSSILQPSTMLSAHDPTVILPSMRYLNALGSLVHAPLNGVIRRMRRGWQAPLDELRKTLGLPLDRRCFTDSMISPQLNLALFSPAFAGPVRDWPRSTRQTGFIFADRHTHTEGLAPEIRSFLAAGPRPVVFTLGSNVVHIGDQFFDESVRAARILGARALFVAGAGAARLTGLPKDMMACEYAPYSDLFPHAAVVVHQCGVGTVAETLLAGRPCLAVPFGLDQFDNGARLERLGIAAYLPSRRYTAPRAAKSLARLLKSSRAAARAAVLAERVRSEGGLQATGDALLAHFAR